MSKFAHATIVAALLAIAPTASFAGHAQHHGCSPAAPTPNGNMMGRGMMGPGMMSGGLMGRGMMGGGMMGPGMMMFGMQHLEGRLAFLKTELKITDAQSTQWNRFADAYRAAAQPSAANADASAETPDLTLPARLARRQKMLSMQLDRLNSVSAPLLALYAVLSDEQKAAADDMFGMGMR